MALIVSTLAASCALQAAVTIGDDFQSYTPASVLPTGDLPDVWRTAAANRLDDGENIFTRVETDTLDLFGSGTANQYLRFQAVATTSSTYHNVATNFQNIATTGQISLRFYEPVDAAATGSGFILRIGRGATANSGTAFGLAFQSGTLYATTGASVGVGGALATYSQTTAHTLTVVFNNSTSNVTYDGTRSLVANTMDVWLNGTLVASGVAKSGELATNAIINGINFTAKNGSVGTLCIDDVAVSDTISITSIPEPGITALAGSILVGLTVLVRRLRPRSRS
ncbi:anchor protein [Opitutaceae bacterium TAV5]|nr:anchor protein [Opitutaceae bacterium TAV5]